MQKLIISEEYYYVSDSSLFYYYREFLSAFIDFPKPIVAAVNGPAVGISVTPLGLLAMVLTRQIKLHFIHRS